LPADAAGSRVSSGRARSRARPAGSVRSLSALRRRPTPRFAGGGRPWGPRPANRSGTAGAPHGFVRPSGVRNVSLPHDGIHASLCQWWPERQHSELRDSTRCWRAASYSINACIKQVSTTCRRRGSTFRTDIALAAPAPYASPMSSGARPSYGADVDASEPDVSLRLSRWMRCLV